MGTSWIDEERSDATSWDQLSKAVSGFPSWGHTWPIAIGTVPSFRCIFLGQCEEAPRRLVLARVQLAELAFWEASVSPRESAQL